MCCKHVSINLFSAWDDAIWRHETILHGSGTQGVKKIHFLKFFNFFIVIWSGSLKIHFAAHTSCIVMNDIYMTLHVVAGV